MKIVKAEAITVKAKPMGKPYWGSSAWGQVNPSQRKGMSTEYLAPVRRRFIYTSTYNAVVAARFPYFTHAAFTQWRDQGAEPKLNHCCGTRIKEPTLWVASKDIAGRRSENCETPFCLIRNR